MDRSIKACAERHRARMKELEEGDLFLMGKSELLELIGHLKWKIILLRKEAEGHNG